MKINRMRVDQFRLFRQPLELSFDDGLNLFCGPNESGKSSLVRAVRAAFFERHRSSSVDDLRPWDDSSAAPEVEVEFQFDGQHWHLQKRFLARKRCDLHIDSQALEGDEAEDRLAALLGYQFSGRGASKAEHWGVPGLLWVEQGTGQELEPSVRYAGDHLKSALGDDLGAVTSSGGDDILQQVGVMRAELLTGGGKPRAAYKEAIEDVERLEAESAALDDRVQQYQQWVDRLGDLREQQSADDIERPWESLQSQLTQAQRGLEEVQTLAQDLQRTQVSLNERTRELGLIEDQLNGFTDLRQEVEKRGNELARKRERFQELLDNQAALTPRQSTAKGAYAQAKRNSERLHDQQRRCAIEQQLFRARQEQQRLQASLQRGREVQSALLTAQKAFQRIALDDRVLEQLKSLETERRELAIQQQSIATRISYALEPGRSITLAGTKLSGSGERRLTEPAELNIPGVGHLTIQPGGQDLGELARQIAQVEQRLDDKLREHQLSSLAQAQERVDETLRLRAEIKNLQSTLAGVAPDGVDALQRALSLVSESVSDLEVELGSAPEIPEELPPADEIAQALTAAEAGLEQLEDQSRELANQLIRIETEISSSQAELDQISERLGSEGHQQQEKNLRTRKVSLQADLETLERRLADLNAQIQDARPDLLEQDVQRLTKSLDTLQQRRESRGSEIIRLEGVLSGQGANGLEEQRAILAAELEQAKRRHQQLAVRAQALDLLYRRLGEKREALTRRLQAPLLNHINHYLGILFPGAAIEVDEHLMPGQLTRNGEVVSFSDLSFGAREQMGLISRLAYADLLKDAGRPTLIILDDALVHSDRERLAQMKRVLFDAAQRHQILIFTCHPQNWGDMGVAVQELAALGT